MPYFFPRTDGKRDCRQEMDKFSFHHSYHLLALWIFFFFPYVHGRSVYCASYSATPKSGICKDRTFKLKKCNDELSFSQFYIDAAERQICDLEWYSTLNCSAEIDIACKSYFASSSVSKCRYLHCQIPHLCDLFEGLYTHQILRLVIYSVF